MRSTAAKIRRLIGRNVSAKRRELALTQEQLAERLEVSARYVQSVEAGNENLTVDSLCKLAAALETSFESLVVETPAKPSRAS